MVTHTCGLQHGSMLMRHAWRCSVRRVTDTHSHIAACRLPSARARALWTYTQAHAPRTSSNTHETKPSDEEPVVEAPNSHTRSVEEEQAFWLKKHTGGERHHTAPRPPPSPQHCCCRALAWALVWAMYCRTACSISSCSSRLRPRTSALSMRARAALFLRARSIGGLPGGKEFPRQQRQQQGAHSMGVSFLLQFAG